MHIPKWSLMEMLVTILTLNTVAATGLGAPAPVEVPSPEVVAKLIAQLGVEDVATRQQASDKLAEYGGPVLPALRKAIAASTEAQNKRRLDLVVTKIENTLVKAEEKHWQDFDASRRGIKDRLVKIVAKTPALSDQQTTTAIYLLCLGRVPSDDEAKQVQKQLVETKGKAACALAAARSLVQGKEFCAPVANINISLAEVRTNIASETDLAKKLHRLNGDEFQKLTTDSAAALDKAVKTDEQLIDLAYLLSLSRFPKADESERAVAHLKKAGRQSGTSDMLWALMNTKEFLMAD